MDHTQLSLLVATLFGSRRSRTTRTARTCRVAVEQEHLLLDPVTGSSVPPERTSAAITGRAYADLVSFEPGGQVELSLRPADDPATLAATLRATTTALRRDLAAYGIALAPGAVGELGPRHLRSPRYDAMERHLDTVGPAGRRMMRATASTQVCLDWWPGRAGLEQWRVLLLAGPFLAAALCDGPDGRLATWLAVDPGRTAFDGRLLHGDDPAAAYTAFATGATAFVNTAAEHLTTLFPPVRPRAGYLEVRFPDARPAEQVEALVTGLSALLYDDQRRRAALDSLRGEQRRLDDLWTRAATGGLDPARGLELLGRTTGEVVAA